MIRIRLKELMEERGLTQAKLSRMADLDLTTVKRLVRCPEGVFNTVTLDKLCRALRVDISRLVECELPLSHALDDARGRGHTS